MKMALDLFGKYDDTEDISNITVNKDYARIHEHNNRREDLQRLEELQKRGEVVDSESESSESESEHFNDDDAIKKFMQVLAKVKNQDPIIKQKDAKLFESEDEESEEEIDRKEKKESKPTYLKDVIAENLLKQGGEDADEDMGSRVKPGGKSYNEEQEELKKKILDVIAEHEFDNGNEDLIKEKKRMEEEDDGKNEELKKACDDYFGKDEEFLKKFILTKPWVVKEDKGKRAVNDDLDALSEDEEELWDQEIYEKQFNFKYEEDAGNMILGHPRVIEGTVRKKTNCREGQRKRKKQRMDEAERRKREELKHLKNLKKKVIMEKLEKIRTIGGLTVGEACALDADDLEDDFDPVEYDKKMKKTFNDVYYNAEDAAFGNEEDDEDGDIEKPDFDKEDELLGLPKDWDVCGTSDGFAAIREKVSLHKDMDEYDKMDYEGTIGELKTRFKYAQVAPQRFRLSAKQIIMMDDKKLNQYVPLKKIATYTETEWKVPKKLSNQLKMEIKLAEQEDGSKNGKAPKNHGRKGSRTLEPVTEEKERIQVEEVNGDVGERSKKRKRKDRMKKVKPSEERRKAYGIGDPQPKNNRTDAVMVGGRVDVSTNKGLGY